MIDKPRSGVALLDPRSARFFADRFRHVARIPLVLFFCSILSACVSGNLATSASPPAPADPTIAILRGTELTAPGETAFAAQCADRARRLFERAGLSVVFVSDDVAQLDLRRYSLLVLPYNPALSARQTALLERFAKRRGRLAVFYHSNARLAQRMGFKPLPAVTQSEPWHTVAFYTNAVAGLPSSMAHVAPHLLPVRANHKFACHLGRWVNPDGIPDHSLPACAVSPKGLWFSHVPPLASPAAARWLLAALAVSDPATYAAACDRRTEEAVRRDAQAAALLAGCPAPADEIRAVWTRPLSPAPATTPSGSSPPTASTSSSNNSPAPASPTILRTRPCPDPTSASAATATSCPAPSRSPTPTALRSTPGSSAGISTDSPKPLSPPCAPKTASCRMPAETK